MEIYTIGFTKKSAEEFFQILEENDIEQVVDVRLNNVSQLAGFTKKNDLKFFLKELLGIDYYHMDILAPNKDLRKLVQEWDRYSAGYLKLLEDRNILERLEPEFFRKRTCLLCSEPSASRCHRGILADYLKDHWRDVQVVHL